MNINTNNTTTYYGPDCAVFKKTKELHGALSNMAAGFEILVNGVKILTSEALYQACRYPHLPELQKTIIAQASPMGAKMKSKPYRKNDSRPDFDDLKVDIMDWCLRVKLAQNPHTFGSLLEKTGTKDIVEDSRNDRLWGAVRDKDKPDNLVGCNVLGKLLVNLRTFYRENKLNPEILQVVAPLPIPDFTLYGKSIGIIDGRVK